MNIKQLIAYISLTLILLCGQQKILGQAVIPGTSYYYTDFSDGILPEGWSTSVPGYSATIKEMAFELIINKSSGGDHYTLGNLNVEDFDLRPYVTISYSSLDTLRTGVTLFEQQHSISPQEIFTLPASGEWTTYTFNLSALASESWGYDLNSIQLVFQPGSSGYEGTFSMNEMIIGDSINNKIFRIGLDQPPPISVDLGNDTTILVPASLILDAGNPGETYLWSTRETGQSIQVDTSGMYHVIVIGTNNCFMTDTIQVTVDVEDGMIDQNAGSGLIIKPNPAENMIQLEVSDQLLGSSLLVFDMSGRLMENIIVTNKLFRINISYYTPGMYFIGLPGKSCFTKFIKN